MVQFFLFLALLCALLHITALKLNVKSQRVEKTVLWSTESRKGKGKRSSAESVPQEGGAAPRRVTSGTGVSIRKQIAQAKANKRLMATKSSSSGVRTKFTKQRGERQEKEEYVEFDYAATKPPAVFVDGYNVIGYMRRENEHDQVVSMEDARDSLVRDLGVLATATGWYIECVFDAYMASRDTTSTSSLSSAEGGVAVTYTARSETADTYIERRLTELSDEGYSNAVVATDDNMLRSIGGDAGNGYLAVSQLLEELRMAFAGWDSVADDLGEEARRKRPKLGSTVASPELTDAMVRLHKIEAISRETEELRRDEDERQHRVRMELAAAAMYLGEGGDGNNEDEAGCYDRLGDDLDAKDKAKGMGKDRGSTKRKKEGGNRKATRGLREPTVSVSTMGVGSDGKFTTGMALGMSSEVQKAFRMLEALEKEKDREN